MDVAGDTNKNKGADTMDAAGNGEADTMTAEMDWYQGLSKSKATVPEDASNSYQEASSTQWGSSDTDNWWNRWRGGDWRSMLRD